MELASPSSRASIVSMNGGDNGSVVMVDSDGVVMSTDNTTAVVGGGNGSPFSRLRYSFLHIYIFHLNLSKLVLFAVLYVNFIVR